MNPTLKHYQNEIAKNPLLAAGLVVITLLILFLLLFRPLLQQQQALEATVALQADQLAEIQSMASQWPVVSTSKNQRLFSNTQQLRSWLTETAHKLNLPLTRIQSGGRDGQLLTLRSEAIPFPSLGPLLAELKKSNIQIDQLQIERSRQANLVDMNLSVSLVGRSR